MCLLALIAEEPCYGYEMAGKMQARGVALVSEGSIYPLLSRLQKLAFIEGYFVESPEGPPRKYYRIAPTGREHLERWRGEWSAFAEGVDRVLNGDRDD